MDTSAPTLTYPRANGRPPSCPTAALPPPSSHSHYGAFSACQVHAKQTVSALGELTRAWEALDK